MIKSHQKLLNSILILIDSIIISLALILAWLVRFETEIFAPSQWHLDFKTYMVPLVFIIPLYLLIYNALGLYAPHRMKKIDSEILTLIKANIIGLLILISMLFIVKQIHYSRYVLLLFVIFSVLLSISERVLLRKALRELRKHGFNQKHVLVIGAGDLGCSFAYKIQQNKHLGYNIVGFLDDEMKVGYKIGNGYVLGNIDYLPTVIFNYDLDEVIIAIPLKQYDRLNNIIKTCEKYGVKAQIIPDYYKYLPAKPYVDQLDDIPIINIRHVPLDDAFNKLIKRTMDIVLSITGIILTSPILLLTATVIKLTSPGPVLFKQTRVGLHRRAFEMYKFRSMKVQKDEEEKTQWTTKNDPRKTKFGNFIRRTSIDELPQLFNVLKGDMSLIGPRPERPYFVEKFREEIPKYMIKHHVRPGITGWAQVNGWRGDTSIKRRIEHDIYYIENWSLWLDIKIIFLTIFKGFINKNAY
ncbi:undecaprenyl-phosphate glucose phosphotransferase [Thermotalea metallivorans]|uniref:UDP-glucose:undecaprenyl-phosphate glucose-1-phosphate transferase n=1 Tax=Thermotalea metallivorans TaxID=520762 RepID=A0A140L6W7_9FIRM|nr:undecaprenyl-phosphate glucose phosphotransferase [Thermotalea metallivorans]KXG76292.1 UDP-glucose:undecaprenyl-phosphate glucose-1-phosphate transferase [Thermotalea metallivorans]